MPPNLLNHLFWVGRVHFTAAEPSSICVFPHLWNYLVWLHLPVCSVVFADWTQRLSCYWHHLSYACPSLLLSQGQWHALIEPLPQLPWRLFSHWAGHHSLSQWWCDKCYNYVNSVQPKCFCRLNIASWKPLSVMLSALRSAAKNPSFVAALLHTSDSFFCSPVFHFFYTLFLKEGNRWKQSH